MTDLKLFKDIVDAHIEAMGMVAENTMREDQGYTIAYDAEAFLEVRDRLEANYVESMARRETQGS